MALPQRKPRRSSESRLTRVANDNERVRLVVDNDKKIETTIKEEIIKYQYPRGDEAFEEKLERELGSDPTLKEDATSIRAMRAIKNACPDLKNINPEHLHLWVIHPKTSKTNDRLNFAPARSFGVNPENISYTIHRGSGESATSWEKKANVDVQTGGQRPSEAAELVIVLDPEVRPSSKLLQGVKPGHWIAWPLKSAGALRAMGYTFQGVVEHKGAMPSVDKKERDFWKKKEVETDLELRKASKEAGEGAVTYEEAAKAVKEVYGTEENIVENYKKLIEKVEEKYPEAMEKGESILDAELEIDGKTIELRKFNTTLPLREQEYDERDLAIFKKPNI